MSQAVFARLLNVSTKTVQSWEQGVRTPSHASRRLLQIYSQHPEAVCQSVGLPPIKLQGVTIKQVALRPAQDRGSRRWEPKESEGSSDQGYPLSRTTEWVPTPTEKGIRPPAVSGLCDQTIMGSVA